ncbi:hypothetical protein F9C07_5094 [Aspergillus flavus]|uniref:Survival Motor Neuron Gemin2-binding domain-containing protein n=1 Tax=Aspergillus flavus (strain ATCC 200026 / FGSC A1120 / IAM 13836 / NRRL 3357 / JCM 12722 / SRRC 167) TaxID=332952 RepID=A0A7G5K1M1_ASPFN|nr:uncharacterized protein G4B84_005026 [Aspergillus flavus NRRL3357]KAJ1705976.1 hypothetical protein NYO67_11870 [Aspergillus flavus]KAF7618418.1 hypothetical protein AFLA_007311 [Aspergillus flavus NRRL3357]QMW29691.1 hypothetical protein G4B84_005026 [Aspergillus flavus NRRL3357]QMW41763.1 hypothetical protein G4B11_005087 [Aspergillus flavus]QRD86077.1 hypothetical protein F9C07_5094 [Aspergillus flavus]
MGKNKNATKALTQEEIWDDSALVQSWDEAVEEYKLYHSIHAKGENVEDVLRDAQGAENEQIIQEDDQEVDHMEADVDEPAIDSVAASAEAQHIPQTDVSQKAGSPEVSVQGTNTTDGPNLLGAAMPQAMLSQVQDEGLKNLMMSWYFAGYYTGLYEGQQRANQNKSS